MRRALLACLLALCAAIGCAGLKPGRGPEPLDELVRTIDDNPDPCHVDYTASVHKLIELGDPAIPRMLDLMLLDGETAWLTRLHATTVLYGIVLRKYGWESGRGWSEPCESGAEANARTDRVNAFWASLGNLSDSAPLAERQRSVALWREWLAKGGEWPGK